MENINCGSVAQLVEQRTENPCVAGSIPARATFIIEPTCNTKNILISLIPFISTPSVKNKI